MRLLGAIGTVVWDTNWFGSLASGGEEVVEQWGGAAYSLASLSAVCPAEWRVAPIVKVGSDRELEAAAFLRSLPGVEPGAGVRVVSEPNNRVELRYLDSAHRCETQSGGVPPWRWGELEPLVAGVDALYVNFISGSELELETALRIREGFAGPIYADLHSLFLSPPGGGARVHRPLPFAREWLSCFDAIQLNEVELRLLAGGRNEAGFLPEVLRSGPGLVVITLGPEGGRYAVRNDLPTDPLLWRGTEAHGRVRTGFLPPPLGALAGDPTGCGDVWGAGFFMGLLSGLGVEAAMSRAQRLAAEKILHPGTATLREHLRRSLG